MARFAAAAILLALGAAARAGPSVVVSVKPLHGLAASVMEGVATPQLLVQGGGSPHGYALRPSQARALGRADLVVWVGPSLELFLSRALGRERAAARMLTLEELPGMLRLRAREGGVWDHPAHEAHAARLGDRDGLDPHLWLSPHNARVTARAIAARLSELDPANAPRYAVNVASTLLRIDAADAGIGSRLAPVQHVPYVVFHDAYAYFEHHYGMRAVAALSINPERPPGAKRLQAIRRRIEALGIRCVFSEPQFAPRLVATVIEGSGARSAVLDPLGAEIPAGPDAWFELMEALAESLRACLAS